MTLWQTCPYTHATLPDATLTQLRTLLDDICIDGALLTGEETEYGKNSVIFITYIVEYTVTC